MTSSPAATAASLVGRTLGGTLEVMRLLGAGGMGAVYEVRFPDGRRAAAKVIAPDVAGKDEIALRRFLREARAATSVKNPHVVEVAELGADLELGAPYFVMELLQGRDLSQALKELAPLEPAVAVRLFRQALEGLAAAHAQGVVHRDIKPSNLFLHEPGDGTVVVKVCDFGVAKREEERAELATTELTRTGGVLGSPGYMSPEQAQNAKYVDARSDLWSLCISLYEALSGRRAWAGLSSLGEILVAICTRDLKPLRELAPWLDPRLVGIVEKGLRRDREERWSSAEELRGALAPFCGGRKEVRVEDVRTVSTSMRGTKVSFAGPSAATRTEPSLAELPKRGPRGQRRTFAMMAALAISGGAAGLAYRWMHRASPRALESVEPAKVPKKLELRQLTHNTQGSKGALAVAYSPDGSRLAYFDGRHAHVLDGAGSPIAELGGDEDTFCRLSWLPDGRGIALAYGAWMLSGESGRSAGGVVVYSPDGTRRIEWRRPDDHIDLLDEQSGLPVRSYARPEGTLWFDDVQIAPDGERVAALVFGSQSSLWILGPAGAEKVDEAPRLAAPRWSPLENAVYYLRGDSVDLDLVKARPGRPSEPAPLVRRLAADLGDCGGISISPSGERLAFVHAAPHRRVVRLHRREGGWDVRPLTDEAGSRQWLDVSRDKRQLAFTQRHARGIEVRVRDLADERDALVYSNPDSLDASVTWSPSGDRLSVGLRIKDAMAIVLVPADGRLHEGTELTAPGGSPDTLLTTWLDDRTILYSAVGNRGVLAIDVQTGIITRKIWPEDGFFFLGPISPDGKTLATFWNARAHPQGVYLYRVADDHLEHVPESLSYDALAWEGPDRLLLGDLMPGKEVFVLHHSKVERVGEVPVQGVLTSLAAVEDGYVAIDDATTGDVWIATNFDPDAPEPAR